MNKPRILLINPPFQRLSKVKNPYFPLGLGYLAAVLDKDGFFVRIYNADKDPEENSFFDISSNKNRIRAHRNFIRSFNKNVPVWDEIKKVIIDFRPMIIGISCMTSNFPSAKRVSSIAKEVNNKIIIIMGGVHPTISPKEVLGDSNCDFILIGEGEETIIELINNLIKKDKKFEDIEGVGFKKNGKVILNPRRECIKNLDSLPIPARHLNIFQELYLKEEMGSIVSSRGCPFNCSFCNAKNLWGRKVGLHSEERMLSEIKYLKRKYGIDHFDFQDDSFTTNKERVTKFCNQLIDDRMKITWSCFSRIDLDNDLIRLMKKAGCNIIAYGVESGSQRILKKMKKNIRLADILQTITLTKNAGIIARTCFLIGTPDETEKDLLKTIQFMKKLKPDFITLCVFTPYPKTELYARAKELDLIEDNIDWVKFSHHSEFNYFTTMPYENFKKLRKEAESVADEINAKINLRKIRNWFRINNKKIVRNPFIILTKINQRIITPYVNRLVR